MVFPRLKVFAEYGLLYRARVDDSGTDLGRLQQRGSVWRWVPLGPAQLMFSGLPPDLSAIL